MAAPERRMIWLILLFLGLVIVACSLVALIYAFQPVQVLTEQAPLQPTLFTAP